MKFTAFARSLQGTGASRRLRNAGKVPGIVYGAGEPCLIELDHNALFHALRKEAFHSSILDMELDGQVQPVLLRDHQVHPFKSLVLHVDFQRIDATTRITKRVPVHYTGEADSPAVKVDKCVINHIASELHIECLASALPEFLTVDLSSMTRGASLHLNDVKFPEGITVLTHGKKNPVLATAVEPAAEEEIVVVAAAPADAKKGKGKKDEKQNKK